MQRLASELAGVAVPPETHFFVHAALPLLERGAFPLDRSALREALHSYLAIPSCRNLDLDVERAVERLGGRSADVWDLFAAIVATLAGDAPIVGEKTPEHLLWCEHLARVWPDLRVLLVVRDPRAVVASNLAVPFGMSRPGLLAERWRADQRLVVEAERSLGPRALRLRYEDVVADPDGARRRIADHLGVGHDIDPSGGARYVAWETWKSRVDEPVTDVRVDAWREVLTERDVALVERICADSMTVFGYRPESSRRARRAGSADGLRRRRYRRARRRLEARITRLAA